MKPILSLTGKDFLTGITLAGAHASGGGLFYKADGVTPLYEAGTAQSVNNGLLMPGASGTLVGGTPNGNFICSLVHDFGTAPYAFFGTSTGHIFRQELTAAATPPSGTNLSDLHTVTSDKIFSMEVLKPKSGTAKIYYWTTSAIGDYDGTSFDDTGTFSSGGSTTSTAYVRPTHRYFDQILYGNGYGLVGTLSDDGASGVKNTVDALDIPGLSFATAIADDGVYAVIALTNNIACDPSAYADTRIIFWDGFSSSWQREYPISDPFILSVKKTPIGVYAFGITGIWQISFDGGVKKIVSHSPGIYTTTGYNTLLYGRNAASFFSDSLVWGGSSGNNYAVKSLGKLDASAPSAYLHPFKSTAGKNITLVDGQLLKGWVYVADDTPQLKAYPFSTANSPQTDISAQTIYFPLSQRVQINRMEIVFGEPLASGDAFDIDTRVDEDTAAVDFDSVSYATDGAVRRKVMTPKTNATPIADSQISFILNWTGGAVKVKRIDVYGQPTSL